MPNLTGRDVHIDRPLTDMSIGYKNTSYIADDFFPVLRVNKQADIVPKYDQSAWFRNQAALRAPGSKSARAGFSVDNTDSYFCPRYSFGFEIPDEIRDNADDPFNLDRDGMEFVTDKLQMCREVAVASAAFATSKWATDKTGGSDFTVFSDYGNSTPLVVLSGYLDDGEAQIGREYNRLTMGKQVWIKLKWHPDVIDTIKYTQRAQMTVDLFGGLVEVQKVLIGRAIQTTTVDGTAEASVTYSRIWGKHILLTYCPDRPSLMTPAAGYSFVWERVPGAMQYVKRIREESEERDVIEGSSYFVPKITASRAGLFMSGAVA